MDFKNCKDLPVWAEILLKEASSREETAEEALPGAEVEIVAAA